MKKDVYELTNAQKSIWLTEQYLKNTSIGNITGNIPIFEKIDIEKLTKSIQEFVKRNDSMRTKLFLENGIPKQYFDNFSDFPIEIKKVSSQEEVDKMAKKMAHTPFALLESTLFAFTIFIFPNGHGGMLISIHHIIGDAWTAGLIVSNIMDIYESLTHTGKLNENKSFSYLDFIHSEKEYLNSSKFEKDEEFWKQTLGSIPLVPEIPSKKRMETNINMEYTSKRKEFLLSKEFVLNINNFCKKYHISIYNFFMGIFAIYTNRVCNLDDFVIGTPILNRSNFKEKLSTGMYISTIPFKFHIDATLDFPSFVQIISQDMRQVFRHQKYPYQNILQNLRKQNPQVPNLYDFLISYQNMRMDTKINSIPYQATWVQNGNISDSLNIHLFDMNDVGTLNIAYDYQINKYADEDMIVLHSRILTIISQILENNSLAIQKLEILSEQDKKELQKNILSTKSDFTFCSNILEQIEQNTKQNLNHIAIETANESITYQELLSRVNKLANFFMLNGLSKNSNIGIFTNRSIDVIVGILAILKIGSTYVPIDPEYPRNRINYMVDKANLDFILTDNLDFMERIENKKISFFAINHEQYNNCSPIFDKKITYDENQNLYIVFTSGSTGNPKGVTISHKNMLNLIYFEKEKTSLLTGNNRILQFATMSFDVSYQEIYSALLTGSTLVLIDENSRKDSNKLTNYLLEKQIDTLFIPPAYLRLLTEENTNIEKFKTYIKNIITAGEQLVITKGIKQLLLAGITIHNHYGPAETHVATTYLVDEKNTQIKPPIGNPISNTNIYILDNYHKICPTYTIGQIAISGDCVGNGYFNNQNLTDEKFLTDFYSDKKMYLTGDLGYIDDNYCVHYLGRQDFQVKINGFRIELEEIDKVFMNLKNVQNAVSVILEENHKKHIVTYYTLLKETSETVLLQQLKEKLPHYMIPSHMIKLEQFPLTLNGKVDKKALPKVNLLHTTMEFIEPKTPLEIQFAKIWEEIFDINKISTNYNFFAIGGDSLLAIKLSAKILNSFQVDISVKDIFKTPVFSDLLNLICMNQSKTKNKLQIAEEKKFYPLSSAQKRIYYTNRVIGENHVVYNLPGAILIKEVLDSKKVENAFNLLIKKHTSFRTSFHLMNQVPMQKIEKELSINLLVKHESSKNMEKLIDTFPTSFDLSKAPLLHLTMYILDYEKTLLLIDTHHIIVDGTSLNIVMKDFCDFYNDSCKSFDKTFSYKDFAIFENKQNSAELTNIENYWVSKFENKTIPVLNLPYDYARPVMKSYRGNKISKKIRQADFTKYENFAKSLGLSPYMFFLASFFLVLYKYTNQEHLIVGTPTAGRDLEELQNLVGMFVNNIVLSYEIAENDTILEFLEKVKNTTIDALTYQPYPFDKLVKKLNVPKDTSRNPLFDVMFIYQNMQANSLSIHGKDVKILEAKTDISKFDLSLEVIPSSCTIRIEYGKDLFKKHTIEQFMEHYLEALENMYQNHSQKVSEISILRTEDKKYLLEDFNKTDLPYPQNETISTLFEKQVRKTPNEIALTFHNTSLTFDELNKKANCLANYLRSLGITRNDIVGIMLPRSLELIIAMLAVLKAGGTYIPIDPMYPKDRTEYMLENSQAKFLLTFSKLGKNVNFKNSIAIELENTTIYSLDDKNLKNINEPLDSSYIIYTSGSTGLPKGVVLNHKALVNLSYHLNNYVDFLNGTSFAKNMVSVTTASFDIFIFETLICLQKGLKIILADEEEQRVPSLLNQLIEKENAQIIQMTPSRMQFLVDNQKEIPTISQLQYVVLAGEPLPIHLLKTLKKLGIKKVYNGYGPSETTVFSTFTDVTNYQKMTIGKPLANTQIYLLDKNLNLVPQGVAGELYIAGDGIGNGYLNQPELTNKSFIKNPFVANTLMYKTGDSGKLLPNGEICYLERIDNQVKIRGLRIELEEIEKKILKFPGIQKVKVVKQTLQNREFISSYFIANTRIRVSELRNYLAKQLPNYMVPSYFTALDEFPYTPNGKIDKKALPLPKAITKQETKIEKPTTKTQKQLVEIWEKLLHVSPIGIQDNFFELGGDSILAMTLHIELLKLTNKITYADIFSTPCLEDLAKLIDSQKRKSSEKLEESLKHQFDDILKPCLTLPKEYVYQSPKNILLVGVTGFLGSHILDSFLQKEKGNIYCLIRDEPGLTPQIKLLDKLHFYFGTKYDSLIDERIFVIKCNMLDKNLGLSQKTLNDLALHIDIVINCAAKVSHYGSYESFYDVNVKSVNYLIDFCMNYDKKFYQVSTLSVSGNSFVDQYYEEQNMTEDVDYKENNFYIGQPLNNVYIRTKFEAEKSVLSAIQKGLDAYILRVGNLMPRKSDGKFQPNIKENAYLNRLLAFLEIGCIPKSLLTGYLEFTPIDYTADAILALLCYPSQQNRIFHIFNDKHIQISDFLNLLKFYNYVIDIVSETDFKTKVKNMLEDDIQKQLLTHLMNDFDKDLNLSYKTNIILKSELTKKYLKNIGFDWPIIDSNYIKNLITCIELLRKGDLNG